MQVRIKVWITGEDGHVIFGAGRMRLLDAVHRTGSILQASEEMKMSYRSAWGRIKATEQRLGEAVIEKCPRGRRAARGLTPRGGNC
jgi:molybdate transport system regulatory protein